MAEPSRKISIPGSERKRASSSRLIEPLKDDETLSINLVLRFPLGAPPLPDLSYRGKLPLHKRRFLSRLGYSETYGAAATDLAAVLDFVKSHSLTATECILTTRNITVEGTAGQFNMAFGIQLNRYESPLLRRRAKTDDKPSPETHIHRDYDGPIYLPSELTRIIIAVVGLDDRSRGGSAGGNDPPNAMPLTVPQLMGPTLYNFPASKATGQTIGIIAPQNPKVLGMTGFTQEDLDEYFDGLGLPYVIPMQVELEVDGVTYTNYTEGAGLEITADICIAASAGQGATINVYWTVDNELGWQTLLNRVLQPPTDAAENPPTVLTTSFYLSHADDPSFTDPSFYQGDFGSVAGVISGIFQSLASIWVNVFAAVGDSGSDSELGLPDDDGLPHLQYPGIDPYVISCGGTVIGQQNGSPSLALEYIWSDIGNANSIASGTTGGGASMNFSTPPWQSAAGITQIVDTNVKPYPGRFAPDISGMVSLMQFYQNTVLFPAKGSNAPAGSYGGTSCVAPLYAGLAAVIQSAFGFSPGFLSPLFYQLGVSANSPFNTITAPGNYSSGNGAPFFLGGNTGKVGNTTWDPWSGWDSINGEKLLNGLLGYCLLDDTRTGLVRIAAIHTGSFGYSHRVSIMIG
jgi:kumamolisin